MEIMKVEYLPDVQEEVLDGPNSKKFPLDKVSALGVAFEPLVSAVQTVIGEGGGSGIYFVNTKGTQMFKFKDGAGYLGSLKNGAGTVGGGQAVINPIALNPTMLFMAAALMTIEKKLDDIQELQMDILDFLKAKEKSKIRGNINVLTDVMNNYKYNWDNEKYKTNKHILVQDVRKDAEHSLLLCREQIGRQLSKKKLLHSDKEVNIKIRKLHEEFKNYQHSLYLYSFSAFLEIMLLENFDSQYLKSISTKIEGYAIKYRELYTSCYNQLESLSQSSVQSFLTKGLAGVSKGTGDVIARIPIVSKGPVDEALVAVGGKLKQTTARKTKNVMEVLIESATKSSAPFMENIEAVNKIYNQPLGILFDAENIYFIEDQEV